MPKRLGRLPKGVRMMTMDVFLERIEKDARTGCWNWTGNFVKAGYGTFFLDGKNQRAHRVSYIHFVGPIPKGLLVQHTCDNKKCVNPDHLKIGTDLSNVHDMISKGRRVVSGRKKSTLQRKDVEAIIAALNRGESANSLARKYGTTWGTIGRIKQGISWAHIRRPWSHPPQPKNEKKRSS